MLATPFEAGSNEASRVELAAHAGGAVEASVFGGRTNGAELAVNGPEEQAGTQAGTARMEVWGGGQALRWEANPGEGCVFGRMPHTRE